MLRTPGVPGQAGIGRAAGRAVCFDLRHVVELTRTLHRRHGCCGQPIAGLHRVWGDGRLIYSVIQARPIVRPYPCNA